MTMARPDGTRQRILAHMATLSAPVSSSEIARALGIRPHRCRVHLYKLAGRGAVHCTGTVVRRGGVAKLYRVGPAPVRVVEVRDADSYMRDWRRAVTTQFEARA